MPTLIDAHCHLTTELNSEESINVIAKDVERCIMSTSSYDWNKLKRISEKEGIVYTGFGVHPWYCHLYALKGHLNKQEHYQDVLQCKDGQQLQKIIDILPDPVDLEDYIASEFNADKVSVIGEIGLDKLFRLPENGFYQNASNAPLGNVRVKMSHQVGVFSRFCSLAEENNIPVSIHCVGCHGLLYDLCKRLLMPNNDVRICLHSFTGSLDILTNLWLKEYSHSRIFFSISKCINLRSESKAYELIEKLPLESILTETDFPVDRESPESLSEQIESVVRLITNVHDLPSTEHTAQLIHRNFSRFVSV